MRQKANRITSGLLAVVMLLGLLGPAIPSSKARDVNDPEPHVHTFACYEEYWIDCNNEDLDHNHALDCYAHSGELVCGLEEGEIHIHGNEGCECQLTARILTCDIQEHIHIESCVENRPDEENPGNPNQGAEENVILPSDGTQQKDPVGTDESQKVEQGEEQAEDQEGKQEENKTEKDPADSNELPEGSSVDGDKGGSTSTDKLSVGSSFEDNAEDKIAADSDAVTGASGEMDQDDDGDFFDVCETGEDKGQDALINGDSNAELGRSVEPDEELTMSEDGHVPIEAPVYICGFIEHEHTSTCYQEIWKCRKMLEAIPMINSIGFTPVVRNTMVATSESPRVYFMLQLTEGDENAVIMPESKGNVSFAGDEENFLGTGMYIDGTGSNTFNEIGFTAPGSYKFTILESSAVNNDPNYKYDERIWKLVVDVTEEDGELAATGTYSCPIDYGCTYYPETTEGAEFITIYKGSNGWDSNTVSQANHIMESMTIEEKVGQLFLLHYPGDGSGTVAQAQSLIDKYHPGGYLVFAAMFNNSTPANVRQKIADTQAASNIPLLFTVDEEGGKVVRISDKSQYGHEKFRSPQELKAAGGLSAVVSDSKDKAAFLKDLGLNVNHAPVADVAEPSGYIYARTWGGNGLENAQYVETLINAYSDTGIGTTMKHFPGYGGTSSNTHNGFAINNLSRDEFDHNDLLPFYAGMAAGGQSVMVTHNTINCLDTENPASLSPAIYNLLRNELEFDGVAMTDDLAMGAITNFTGAGQASLRALQAGADMAMTATPDSDIPVVLAAVKNGSLSLNEVEEKCRRILCWKIELGLIDDSIAPPIPPVPDDYEAKYISQNGETIEYGSFTDMWNLAAESSGKVALYKDISIPWNHTMSVDSGRNIELDLMGHTLTSPSHFEGVKVATDAIFTLSDSVGKITQMPMSTPTDTEYSARCLTYSATEKSGNSVEETGYEVNFADAGAFIGSGVDCLVYLKGGTFNLAGGVLENTNGNHAVSSLANSANVINMTGGAILGSGVKSGVNRGGGVYLACGTFSMAGGYIAGNTGITTGGGIFLNEGTVGTITGGVIAGNTTDINGGGIYVMNGCKLSIENAIITGNSAKAQGGGIYGVSSMVTLGRNTVISSNKANTGGGIYGYGTITVTLKGHTLIVDNVAQNGGGICLGLKATTTGTLTLQDNAWVVGNTATESAAGIYNTSPTPIQVEGNVRIAENKKYLYSLGDTVHYNDNNLHLLETQILQITGSMGDNAEIRISSENTASSVKVATPKTGLVITKDDASRFISDNPSYAPALKDNAVFFVAANSVHIPVIIMLDGVPHAVSTIETIYQGGNCAIEVPIPGIETGGGIIEGVTDKVSGDDSIIGGGTSSTTTEYTDKYIVLNDFAPALAEYGFSLANYNGSFVIGLQADEASPVIVYGGAPFKDKNSWCIPVPAWDDYSQAKVYFMPNGSLVGIYPTNKVIQQNGYWSIRVVDTYSVTQDGITDMSSKQYIPAGRSVTLTLPTREFPWEWTVSEHTDRDFIAEVTATEDSTAIKLSKVHASVVVTSGSSGDSRFTAQYFATTTSLDLQNMSFPTPKDAAKAGYLPVIDTSGGVLPRNGITQARKYLEILRSGENLGTVKTKPQTKRVYADRNYVYSQAPSLVYVDRLYTDDHYELVELWVLKQNCNPESLVREDWDIYNKEVLGISSIHDLHLTNSPDYAIPNDTIYIGEGAVVRFVYKPSIGGHQAPVVFYDYDITDGAIYRNFDDIPNTPIATSAQDTLPIVYANTAKQGINSVENYGGDGAHLAFGNANTNMGWDNEIFFNGGQSNTLNKGNAIATNPSNCTFGLVTGLDASGHLMYAPGVVAPNLFNEGSAIGKTAINGLSLNFSRNGDTYTLTGVNGTTATRLDRFNNPQCGSSAPYTHIWTNNFWPMDSADTYGADGHDLRFGDVNKKPNRLYANSEWNRFAESDDGLDHNSYFGMNFSVNFALPENYCGDLEYCFFGDDDMWVFLDGQLILDIGGVHSSVGEYVNLWDYIEQGDTSSHTLQFFYTERGASGSTCWMHFTIPAARFATDSFESRDGSLKIQKSVAGTPNDASQEYKFNVSIMEDDGSQAKDDYSYIVYSANGEISQYGVLRKGVGSFALGDGEYAVFPHIKAGKQYSVTESPYECETNIVIGSNIIDGTEATGTITAGTTLTLHFINNYSKVEYKPGVSKLVEGTNDKDVFNFSIRNIGSTDGVRMPENTQCSVTGSGETEFDAIIFTKSGTYSFEITELNEQIPGYVYDNEIWTLTIVVTASEDKLSIASVEYANEDNSLVTTKAAKFVNQYSIAAAKFIPKVAKTIVGKYDGTEKFRFSIIPTAYNENVTTPDEMSITISGEGNAEFGEFLFTTPGTYKFSIQEDVGTSDQYEYDRSVWTLTVTVVKEGASLQASGIYTKDTGTESDPDAALFVNTRLGKLLPKTGGEGLFPIYAASVGILVCGAALWLVRKRIYC